ncbi:magnesium transporter [Nesterenkonia salmonea]|uniref:magnesium transporter n=1 Tax=Nesterenkonia salmonea TaxID=1804987 RepID=UPI003C7CB22A
MFYGTAIGMIISLTLLVICLWASSVGGILPLVATKLRIDPAVFSAPVITTLVDATGLVRIRMWSAHWFRASIEGALGWSAHQHVGVRGGVSVRAFELTHIWRCFA